MDFNLKNVASFFEDTPPSGVTELPVDSIDPFPGHPYKVEDDAEMDILVDSIREHGITDPLIVRPMPDGRRQLISGHRRLHAARLAGLAAVPAMEVEADDDEATILMVDANLHRERIPDGQRARAMAMKHRALKHQGRRDGKGTTRERLAAQAGSKETTIARLVRVGNLADDRLLDMVDQGRLPLNAADKLTPLEPRHQRIVADWLAGDGRRRMTIAHASAVRLAAETQGDLDAGTVALLAPPPRPRSTDTTEETGHIAGIPVSWLPADVEPDRRLDWIHAAIEAYADMQRRRETA